MATEVQETSDKPATSEQNVEKSESLSITKEKLPSASSQQPQPQQQQPQQQQQQQRQEQPTSSCRLPLDDISSLNLQEKTTSKENLNLPSSSEVSLTSDTLDQSKSLNDEEVVKPTSSVEMLKSTYSPQISAEKAIFQEEQNLENSLISTQYEEKSTSSRQSSYDFDEEHATIEQLQLCQNDEKTTSQKILENMVHVEEIEAGLIKSKQILKKPNEDASSLKCSEKSMSTKQIQFENSSSAQKVTEKQSSQKQNAKNSVSTNPNSSSSTKTQKQRSNKKDKVKLPTKVVIRRLPPTMSEEEFLEQVQPVPEHDAYYYAGPDWSLGFDATCRAYITFKNFDDVLLFCQRFDGYVFVDQKGIEYPAVVEFAPFQGLIRTRSRRNDNKVDTIISEQHYKDFVERLEANREAAARASEKKLEFSLDTKKDDKVTSTPLLQYLANKKEKRREDSKKRIEEKRRQREEEKEKRKQSQQVTKIITSQTAKDNKDQEQSQELRKNSRSKRRAERDQRRREEHERRKRDREKDHREKRNTERSEDSTIGSNNEFKQKSESEKQVQKDSKRNERRERERERNRNRRGKGKDNKDEISATKSNVNSKKDDIPTILKHSSGKKLDEVNDNVKQFIQSVITAKELETVDKKIIETKSVQTKNTLKKETMKDNDDTKVISEALIECSENKRSLTRSPTDENQLQFRERGSPSPVNEKSTHSNCSGTADEQAHHNQRSYREQQRRIRNKDRPSIAIYQPRARRLTDENDSMTNSVKDPRSNPTSDCDTPKNDEQRQKRVKRNSERRTDKKEHEMRRQSKPKSTERVANEDATLIGDSKNHEDRLISKSLEDTS